MEKSKIPLEVGESELLMMLDTTRAIQSGNPVIPGNPNNPNNPNAPHVE
jgi:hypothetical protein